MPESSTPPAAGGRTVRLLNLAGLQRQAPWRLALPRARPLHNLLWLQRGHGRVTIDGRGRGLSPHMALLIPAGHVHGVELTGAVQGLAALLPDDLLLPLPRQPVILRARSIFEQRQVTALFEQMMQERDAARAGNPPPGRDAALVAHLTLLSVWLERHRGANEWSPPATATERLVQRFLRQLETGLGRITDVAGYAAALQVTPTHLARACRAVTDDTPLELIRRRQLLEARLLLADSNASARQIAAACGFASAAHFSRVFKAETGLTPLQFRTAARSPAAPQPPPRRVIRLGDPPLPESRP